MNTTRFTVILKSGRELGADRVLADGGQFLTLERLQPPYSNEFPLMIQVFKENVEYIQITSPEHDPNNKGSSKLSIVPQTS